MMSRICQFLGLCVAASGLRMHFEVRKPVVSAIVMGDLANRKQISLWLSSLREVGKYTDEVMLITDKPKCLVKGLRGSLVLGALLSTNEKVDIYAPGAGQQGNVHIIKRPQTESIKKMKAEKARMWYNVKTATIPHQVSSIIYTDQDIVFGKDLSTFLKAVKSMEKEKYVMALFRDPGAAANQLHTGVAVLFEKQATLKCLQDWAQHLTGHAASKFYLNTEAESHLLADSSNGTSGIESGVGGEDQVALAKSRSCDKSAEHDGIYMLPAQFFLLPTLENMKAESKAEFVHFTSGRWTEKESTGQHTPSAKDRHESREKQLAAIPRIQAGHRAFKVDTTESSAVDTEAEPKYKKQVKEYIKMLGVPNHVNAMDHVDQCEEDDDEDE